MAKILVVDKDRAFHGRAILLVKSLGNHEVECVSDGLKALERICSGRYDLVLLDASPSYLDGLGLLDAARKRHPRCSVILISEKADFKLAQNALRRGAFEILRKPFSDADLKRAISAGLDEADQMKPLGYAYKDSRRNDPVLVKSGVTACVTDSFLVSLAFFLAPFAAGYVGIGSRPLFFGPFESLLTALGLACCYAFAFVLNKSHRTDLVESRAEMAFHLLRNLAYAYVVQIAISFLAKSTSMQPGRLDIALGFVLGLAALMTNRFFLLPNIFSRTSREGGKKLVIESLDGHKTGLADSRGIAQEILIARNALVSASPGPGSRLSPSLDDEPGSKPRKQTVST